MVVSDDPTMYIVITIENEDPVGLIKLVELVMMGQTSMPHHTIHLGTAKAVG